MNFEIQYDRVSLWLLILLNDEPIAMCYTLQTAEATINILRDELQKEVA